MSICIIPFFFIRKPQEKMVRSNGKKCGSPPTSLFDKHKAKMGWKNNDPSTHGAAKWQKIFSAVGKEWKQICSAGNKGAGRPKKKGKAKAKGVKKPKTKKKGKRKLGAGSAGLAWVKNNCSQQTYNRLVSSGKDRAGIGFIRENCSEAAQKKAKSYFKSKRKKTLGGCGCARCRMGLGGCACMSGSNCARYV